MKSWIVKKLLPLGMIFIIMLTGCTVKENNKMKSNNKITKNTETNEDSLILKQNIPTIFFHGYKGGPVSFNGMILRLGQKDWGKRSVTLNVSESGEVSEKGKWIQKDNPLIQVIFADNTNNEWKQAEWMKSVLNYLDENYKTKEVNILGHSMGGVSALRYLVSYGAEGSKIKINKVVTIGSPFNDFNEEEQNLEDIETNGPINKTPRFIEYDNNFNNFPKNLPYLNIAGNVDGKGDGTVPLVSVQSINYLFKKNQRLYDFEIVKGKKAQHSALHENKKVDKLVADFLWKKSN